MLFVLLALFAGLPSCVLANYYLRRTRGPRKYKWWRCCWSLERKEPVSEGRKRVGN